MKKFSHSILAVVLTTAVLASGLTVFGLRLGIGGAALLTGAEYENLALIREVADSIALRFYGETPQREALAQSAVRGMVAALEDPYARYYTQEEYAAYLEQYEGEYTGIGVTVSQAEQGAAVVEVYENGPAALAGIQPGDIVTAVDGQSVQGFTTAQIAEAIPNEPGSTTVLTILREGIQQDYTVTIETVHIKRVHSTLLDGKVGYLRIDQFSGTCTEEFKSALAELTEAGMSSLVLDLRGNPGGNLDIVVAVTDALLPSGKILTVKSADGSEDVYQSDANALGMPLAVLVNENSASGSEIVAAAVQDSGIGLVLGTTTYGKGVVQTTFPLTSDGSWLKLTTAAYYTPSGRSINKVGVVPDVMVEAPDGFVLAGVDQLNPEKDPQLQAAMDWVNGQQ